MNREKILEIKNLKQYFHLDKSTTVKAVDDISFDIYKGEIFGLVGESGSGKSTTGKTIIRLHESTGGEVIYKGNCISDKKTYKFIKKRCKQKYADYFSRFYFIIKSTYDNCRYNFRATKNSRYL